MTNIITTINLVKGMSLVIGNTVKITFLRKSKDEVKLGIEAPRNVKIRRAELLPLKKDNENANNNK